MRIYLLLLMLMLLLLQQVETGDKQVRWALEGHFPHHTTICTFCIVSSAANASVKRSGGGGSSVG
jgi:hypothetical protein